MLDSIATLVHSDHHKLDRSVWYADSFLLTFLATSEETQGEFMLFEALGQKGIPAPPMHKHTREVESFYVLEGQFDFYVGDELIQGTAGSFITLPRGVPHSYNVVSDTARVLNLCVPGGLDGFFRDLSVPARSLSLPPLSDKEIDEEKMMDTCARYGIEIAGPPPA